MFARILIRAHQTTALLEVETHVQTTLGQHLLLETTEIQNLTLLLQFETHVPIEIVVTHSLQEVIATLQEIVHSLLLQEVVALVL